MRFASTLAAIVAFASFAGVVSAQTVNQPPTISGTPPTVIKVKTSYYFQPTARDPEGKALKFSVVNKPGWMVVSPNSGKLMGYPMSPTVYNNIILRVSDGVNTVSLPAFSITVNSTGTIANRSPTISGSPGSPAGIRTAVAAPDAPLPPPVRFAGGPLHRAIGRAERQGRGQATAVIEAARRHHRDLHRFHRLGDQRHGADEAGVAAALAALAGALLAFRRIRPDLIVISSVNGHGFHDGEQLIGRLRDCPTLSTTKAVIGGKLGIAATNRAERVRHLVDAGFDAVFDDAVPLTEFRAFVSTLAIDAAAACAAALANR